MRTSDKNINGTDKVLCIVSAAGGRVVGRTRLQKIAYLLELTGLGEGFSFEYRHYGPYSEELAHATQAAKLVGKLSEDERTTSWGGSYSIFTTLGNANTETENEARACLARLAAEVDSVELELAATAAFLAAEGEGDPWLETMRRKPEKAASGRLEKAQDLYQKLRKIETPNPLPQI